MATPFATPYDVGIRWRPLTDAESAVAGVLVGDASALLRSQFPGLDSQVTTGAVDATVLTAVVAAMVKRALIAPADGLSQQSETIGPYSHSQTYANPLGNLFLTAAEATLIRGYRPRASSITYGNTTCQGTFSVNDLYSAYDGGITVDGA